ncbi:MAG: hypothetical protein AB1916_09895 [Thermodesulfobacteriota bacterium]
MSRSAQRSSGPGMLGWAVAVLSCTALAMGLTLAWCNIERLDLAYRARQVQGELDARLALAAKFEVERANLLSPYRLQEKARELGMQPATAGRIRRLAQAEVRP